MAYTSLLEQKSIAYNCMLCIVYVFLLNSVYNFGVVSSNTSLFKRLENSDNAAKNYFTFRKDDILEDGQSSNSHALRKVLLNAKEVLSSKENVPDSQSRSPFFPDALLRTKRSLLQDGQINNTVAKLNDSNTHLIVHWAGFNSSVLVVLTKNLDISKTVTRSFVYVSYDNGKSFKKIISSQVEHGVVTPGTINNFYSSRSDYQQYIFAEVSPTPKLYLTFDAGRTVTTIDNLPFKPEDLSIHPMKNHVVLALDKTAKRLYKSDNSGRTWRLIQSRVKDAQWGYSTGEEHYDKVDSLYVQREELDGTVTVLRSETYFQEDAADLVLISNVEDFVVMNASMFATRRSDSGGGKELWVAVTRSSRFVRASFFTSEIKREFFIIDASDSQIMVCVNHGPRVTHLYISEPNKVDFSLSLENITYYNPDGPYTTLSLFATERFADIHKVSGLRSIYIANTMSRRNPSDIFDASSMQSVITFNKGGTWEKIPNPTYDEKGDRINNCSSSSGCSLHLTQTFHQVYPHTRASPIFSQPSAPGFVLAQGNVGKNLKREPDLFFSSSGGKDWVEVLAGTWLFTWADHGGIIAALPKFNNTDTLWYTTNQGEVWNTYKFFHEPIRVYGLMTQPGEATTVFSLFGSTNKGGHSWVIVQVDMRRLFSVPCEKDDYKMWSPTDERGITCLMGSQTIFERRNKHSQCYNGKNYDRATSTKICQCTRDDFECDIGYSIPDFLGFYCLPLASANASADVFGISPSCYSGGFYNRSKGYRKLAGDKCSGGSAESHFAPDLVPCPLLEETAFMMVSGISGLYQVDLETNNTVLIDSNINTADMDFDYKTNTLFWLNTTDIMKMNLNTSRSSLIFRHSSKVWYLSFDWMVGNLYWSDGFNISVTNQRGSTRQLPSNCSQILGLAVVPNRGYAYYICFRSSKVVITQMDMDGSRSKVIATPYIPYISSYTTFDFAQRGGLTYDVLTDRLFWVAFNSFGSVYRSGENQSFLHSTSGYAVRSHHISVFKNKAYWVERSYTYGRVKVTDKYDFASPQNIDTVNLRSRFVSSMKTFTRQAQSSVIENPCLRRQCHSICVPAPTNDPQKLNSVCLCGAAKDLIIIVGNDHNEQCTCPQGQFYNHTNHYCQGSNQTCHTNEFLCSNTRCILSLWKCDNENDCGDGSDELGCPKTTCTDSQYICNSTDRCIPSVWKCDHDDDCGDGSDELNCNYPTCTGKEFSCANGRCKNENWVCDGDNDCGDWSDEQHCNSTEPASHCDLQYQFHCLQPTGAWVGNCLPRSWMCDNDTDCADNSDERNCTNHTKTCDIYKKHCDNMQCIYNWWFCDGTQDCDDGSDEHNCSATTLAPTTTSPVLPSNHSCTGTDLKCRTSGACYPRSWHCDGVNDCGDNSDEFDCSTDTGSLLPTIPCFSDIFQFTCGNNRCIFSFYKCDGDNDCGDWSDERGCPNFGNRTNTPGCIEGHGENYQGTRSYTKSGYTCQRWDVTVPHDPHYRPQNPHHNYCRNPDLDSNGPWCYTTDPEKRWEICGIPHCSTHTSSPVPPTAEPQYCPDGYFYCGSNGTSRCIFDRYICDGGDDCGNGVDEENCEDSCNSNEFQCNNNRCVAKSLKCNFRDDCYDNSDEIGCTSAHVNCDSTTFRCRSSSLCVPSWTKCNQRNDCADGSDEASCFSTSTTTAPLFKCTNDRQIPLSDKCDYKPDCDGDMSDEQDCHYLDYVRAASCSASSASSPCMQFTVPNLPNLSSSLGLPFYVIHFMPVAHAYQFNTSLSRTLLKHHRSFTISDGLTFNQKYAYAFALNFTNYTLPKGAVNTFTTAQGVPDAPVIQDLESLFGGSILVKWKPPAHMNTEITGYTILANATGQKSTSQDVSADQTSTVVWVSTTGKWNVYMYARSSLGDGKLSEIKTINLASQTIQPPQNVTVTNKKRLTVDLRWQAETDVQQYKVHVRSASEEFCDIHQKVPGDESMMTIKQLEPGQKFEAQVSALYKNNVTSPPSSWVLFSTSPPSISKIVISKTASLALTTTSIQLNWTAVNDPIATHGITYNVQYGTSLIGNKKSIPVRNKNSIIIKNLPRNDVTFCRVAVSLPYFGRWSDYFSIKPIIDYSLPPANLTVTGSSPWTEAVVSWNSPFSEYGVYGSYELNVTDSRAVSVKTSYIIGRKHSKTITVLPHHIYVITLRDVANGIQGEPATYTYFSGRLIPSPTDIKVIPIPGEQDYELTFLVQDQLSQFYKDALRGVKVTVCKKKDVPSASDTSCNPYHELKGIERSTRLDNLQRNQWYTVFLTLQCVDSRECQSVPAKVVFYTTSYGEVIQPSPSSAVLSKTNVIAIAVSALVVILGLVIGIFFLVRRNRRLSQSYQSFVASHYDPQRGEAFFVNDADEYDNGLDDDVDLDTPMISGFADDEPLIVA